MMHPMVPIELSRRLVLTVCSLRVSYMFIDGQSCFTLLVYYVGKQRLFMTISSLRTLRLQPPTRDLTIAASGRRGLRSGCGNRHAREVGITTFRMCTLPCMGWVQ